jgi:prefoldin subunit 5
MDAGPSSEQPESDDLAAEVALLRRELDALRQEVAALREQSSS